LDLPDLALDLDHPAAGSVLFLAGVVTLIAPLVVSISLVILGVTFTIINRDKIKEWWKNRNSDK